MIRRYIVCTCLALSACNGSYDCSLAEISPDMPIAAKEACRAARGIK